MPSASRNPEPIAQILSKNNYTRQSIVTLSSSSVELEAPLPRSGVRVNTTLIALTANNLGYAALGTQLHRWDAFPVPSPVPPPFNDSAAYGIVSAWGYATILESTIPPIPSGSLKFPLGLLAPIHSLRNSPTNANLTPRPLARNERPPEGPHASDPTFRVCPRTPISPHRTFIRRPREIGQNRPLPTGPSIPLPIHPNLYHRKSLEQNHPPASKDS